MYFINYSKCSVCRQKKSVATEKNKILKVCKDCNPTAYDNIARKQKESWLARNSNKKAAKHYNS